MSDFVILDLNISSINAFIDKLRVLDQTTFNAIIQRIAERTGLKAEEIASVYPPAKKRKKPKLYMRFRPNGAVYYSAFKNAKQAYFVMRLIKEGKVPYRRTGRLGASVTSKVEQRGNVWIITVGTNVSYAPYVLDVPFPRGKQAAIHAYYWTPLAESIQKRQRTILDQTAKDFENAISAYAL